MTALPQEGIEFYAARRQSAGLVGPQLPDAMAMGWTSTPLGSDDALTAAAAENGDRGLAHRTINGRHLRLLCGMLPSSSSSTSAMRCVGAPGSEEHQTTGSVLWDASVVLAKFLEFSCDPATAERYGPVISRRMTETTRPCRCVELGAGLGLAGMAAAVLGQSSGLQVVLTDLPQLIPGLEARLRANSLHNASAQAYAWGGGCPNSSPPACLVADLVLVADCCWHEAQVPILVGAAARVAAADGATLFLAGQRRQQVVEEQLRAQLTAHAFDVSDVPPRRWHPEYGSLRGKLYLLECRRRLAAAAGTTALRGTTLPEPALLSSVAAPVARRRGRHARRHARRHGHSEQAPVVDFEALKRSAR
jgi:predicted nicotinamide N-methyase